MSEKLDLTIGRSERLTKTANDMAEVETARLMSDLGLFREYEREAIKRTLVILYHQGVIDAMQQSLDMISQSHQWDRQRRADAVKGAHP